MSLNNNKTLVDFFSRSKTLFDVFSNITRSCMNRFVGLSSLLGFPSLLLFMCLSLSVASPFLSSVSLLKILLHLQLLVIPLVQLILLPPLTLMDLILLTVHHVLHELSVLLLLLGFCLSSFGPVLILVNLFLF